MGKTARSKNPESRLALKCLPSPWAPGAERMSPHITSIIAPSWSPDKGAENIALYSIAAPPTSVTVCYLLEQSKLILNISVYVWPSSSPSPISHQKLLLRELSFNKKENRSFIGLFELWFLQPATGATESHRYSVILTQLWVTFWVSTDLITDCRGKGWSQTGSLSMTIHYSSERQATQTHRAYCSSLQFQEFYLAILNNE